MITKLILTLLIPQLAISPITGGVIMGKKTLASVPGWVKINEFALEPVITSSAAVVLDPETDQILFKKNHNEKRSIASITKLVSAYTYLKETNNDLDRIITMTKEDERNGGKKNIFQGERGRAEDYLNIALIGSDNSAIAALIRSANLNEPLEQAAAKHLAALGITNTTIVEPTGLSAENRSTALEIARLSNHLFNDKTLKNIVHKKTFAFNPIGSNIVRNIASTNDLLNTALFTVHAGKTGYIEDAGYCIVLKAARPDGKELVVSILGAPSSEDRFQDAKTLVYWIFQNFE